MPKPKSVEEYIAAAPPEAQRLIGELRTILKAVAPDAQEVLKWGTPVYEEERILFAWSAHKKHLNFMPTRTSLAPFEKELQNFTTGKDTIQLPYDQPLPTALIKKIARFRAKDVRENDALWMTLKD